MVQRRDSHAMIEPLFASYGVVEYQTSEPDIRMDLANIFLARSARLFNRRGSTGAWLTDIMRATGLEKGGSITTVPARNNWPGGF